MSPMVGDGATNESDNSDTLRKEKERRCKYKQDRPKDIFGTLKVKMQSGDK